MSLVAICMAGSSFALTTGEYVYTPNARYQIKGEAAASSDFKSFDGWTVVTASDKAIDANFLLETDAETGQNYARSNNATAGEGMAFNFASPGGTYIVSYKMKAGTHTSVRVKTSVLSTNLVTLSYTDGETTTVVNKAEDVTTEWQTYNYAITGDPQVYTLSFTGMATDIQIADLQIASAEQVADLRQRDAMVAKLNAYKDVYDWDPTLLEDIGLTGEEGVIAILNAIGDYSTQGELDDALKTAKDILYSEGAFLDVNMEDYLAGRSDRDNYFDTWRTKWQKESKIGDWSVLPTGRGFWEKGPTYDEAGNLTGGSPYPDLGHYAGSQKWGDMTMGVTMQKVLTKGSYVFSIDGSAAFRENNSSSTWANNDGLKMAVAEAYIMKVPAAGVEPTAADTIQSITQVLDPVDMTTAIVAAKIEEDGTYEFGYKVVTLDEFRGTTAGGVTYIANASIWGKNDNVYNQKQLAYEADVREQITTGRDALTKAGEYVANADYFWGKAALQDSIAKFEPLVAGYEALTQAQIIEGYGDYTGFDEYSYVKDNRTKTAEEGLLVYTVYDTAVRGMLAANKAFLAVNDTLNSMQAIIDNAKATLALRVYDAATGKADLQAAIATAEGVQTEMKAGDYSEENAKTIVAANETLNAAIEAFKATVPSSEITEIVSLDFSNAAAVNAETGLYEVAGTNTVMAFSDFSLTTPSDKYPFELGFDSNGEKLLADVLRIGNGTATATIPAADYGTNIVKVSMDWWMGRLSGRKAGFRLEDEEGNRVAGLYFEPYNFATAPEYDDFGITDLGKFFVANTAGDAAACADNNKTHLEIILDYGEKSMYLTSTIPSGSAATEKVAFSGAIPTKFIVQSGYNYAPARRCWFDNLKIEKITAGETEQFVPSGIEEISNEAAKVKAPTKVFKNGRIIINGKYGINGVLIK